MEVVMQYENVERDFVKRSLELLRQYDEYVLPSVPVDQHYEVTLLLNCLLGLIVLPFEYSKRVQNNLRFPRVCDDDRRTISELDSSWGLDRLKIYRFLLNGKIIKPEEATLRQIVAMFRHSLAHSQFGDGSHNGKPVGLSVTYDVTPYDPIKSVILEVNMVNEYKNQVEFVASIPVNALRQFATCFAISFLGSSSLASDAS
jgi:hypothetical protein